ncbi:MAG: hypothetical protein IPP88_00185 [Betaproteobacteria bacterium]|nr:hypothetical protein [Betaproteobacteria bacterium]
MTEDKFSAGDVPARNTRGKYVTLVVLLLWVAAVLTFTFLKFSGAVK